MPTDNPKISLYVPKQIFDRFKSFQEERKLSMSQAGIVIIAEYFGIEETIKEITEGTTIGGVTLAEFEQLKQKVAELEILAILDRDQKVEQKVTKSELPIVKNQNIDKMLDENKSFDQKLEIVKNKNNPSQLKLINEKTNSISAELLAKRLGIRNYRSIDNKRNLIYKNNNLNSDEKFIEWTRKKDFDSIGWKPVKEQKKINYVVANELDSELLGRLNKWITNNTL